MELLIKNCIVFDPANGINGEKMDIAVKDGKIVEQVRSSAKIIDVEERIVVPGFVDIHTHIASSKVNLARKIRPDDHYRYTLHKKKTLHSGSGFSLPSIKLTGYLYTKMGYTTVMEAAVAPLKIRHTLEELMDLPNVDKGFYVMFGNNWLVMDFIKNNDFEMLQHFISLILSKSGGYAIKIVNPGGAERWSWGKNVSSLDDIVNPFDITPYDILGGLIRVNAELKLPHSIHVHPNNLGHPGNYEIAIDTMNIGNKEKQKYKMHVTHLQFYSYGGTSWRDMNSASDKIAKYVNSHKEITVDIGQILFEDTTTLTADGPLEFDLFKITKTKWCNMDIEVESGGGIVPYVYKKTSIVNSIQWAIGLELALQIKDPWRIFLTTDHPNGGPFFFYPKIITWLMYKKAREKMIEEINKKAIKKILLPTLDREYTFSEIITITSAGPASALGMNKKGHLGTGADADIAVLDLKINDLENRNYNRIEDALMNVWLLVKGGDIIYKNALMKEIQGRLLKPIFNQKKDKKIELEKTLQAYFNQYYSLKLENYLRNLST